MTNYTSPIFRAKDFESVEQLQEPKYISPELKAIGVQFQMFNDFTNEMFKNFHK